MLLDQYDKDPTAILRPEHVVKRINGFPETVVFEFSQALIRETAERYGGVEAGHLVSVAGNTPIYKIDYCGRELGISQCWIGASACISNMEEIVAMGARKIFVCGECGVLDGSIEDARLIIPTAALRDEGTSYHYLPAADEIEMDPDCVNMIEQFFIEKKVPYHKGKIWTTDAPYRETRGKMAMRKASGCIAVDMECSALAAFAKVRGIKYAQFVYAADNLDAEEWQQRGLTVRPVSQRAQIFELALACACRM